MEKKNLDITNMNGMTNDDDTTCGLNDMNCIGDGGDDSTCSITNMNCTTEEDDTTCSFTDMNCMGEK